MKRTFILLSLVLVAGCGGKKAPAPDAQVRTALETFANAVEKRDYQTLCDKVFAPKLLEGLQSIGLPCEVAMRTSFKDVEDPKLTIGAISVNGSAASAEVKTSAMGQPPSTDTLQLQKLKGVWRVSALGSSSEPTATATETATASPPASPTP